MPSNFSIIIFGLVWLVGSFVVTPSNVSSNSGITEQPQDDQTVPRVLATEKVEGREVWVSLPEQDMRPGKFVVKVWFDQQFLGDGTAYLRRAKEFSGMGRRELRANVIETLKRTSNHSHQKAAGQLDRLLEEGTITSLQRHWIVNGFTCTTDRNGLQQLKQVAGVKKIFVVRGRSRQQPRTGKTTSAPKQLASHVSNPFDPGRFKHPWYIHALMVDRVWSEFNIAGQGTLNVVHDFNFVYPDNVAVNAYRNPGEIPDNGKDDDGNGRIDDCFGFNFATESGVLTTKPNAQTPPDLHGTMCAAIICGTGTTDTPYEFGIAPRAKWAGVIASGDIESAVEWAIEQHADTYSMSFSRPNLGEMRSHWRKIMEHGAFCGVYFVSGAGNFAKTAEVPRQMRTPEDIPNVVFAAAGVQRDLSRTEFSSKGPVRWKTEHYRDEQIQKPEVCAFNHGLPLLLQNGSVRPVAINGNSFAGPMFCGSIALMLSADPDLLPWDLKEIITTTATDVGPEGVDFETGHGLINCYRAVKEVLRRKAIRDGNDPRPFEGRSAGDELDPKVYSQRLAERELRVVQLPRQGPAAKSGLKAGDVILTLDGQVVTSAGDWALQIKSAKNDTVKIAVRRGENKLDIIVNADAPGLRRIREFHMSPVFR